MLFNKWLLCPVVSGLLIVGIAAIAIIQWSLMSFIWSAIIAKTPRPLPSLTLEYNQIQPQSDTVAPVTLR